MVHFLIQSVHLFFLQMLKIYVCILTFLQLDLIFLELYAKHFDCIHNYFTHSEHSVGGVEAVSPGHTQYVGQVKAKVYKPPTCSSKVCFGEEGADEEALHDGGGGKRRQEEKYNRRVAVRQNVPPLEIRQREK